MQLTQITSFYSNTCYLFTTIAADFILKILTNPHRGFEDLYMERAVLSVLTDLEFPHTPSMYPIAPESMHPDCIRISILVKFLPGKSVFSYGVSLSPIQIARFAAMMVLILQQLHAHGIIHGDIHRSNILLADPDDVSTVKLVDLGRSIPFISSKSNEHVLDASNVPLDDLHAERLLSPFELEGSLRTRRDDMYRLSETLYRMRVGSDPKWPSDVADLAQAKREWVINREPIFTQFHHAMTNLGFDEEPKYADWIERFTMFADSPILPIP